MHSLKKRDNGFALQLQQCIDAHYPALNARIHPSPKNGFYGEIWELHSQQERFIVKLDTSSRHQRVYDRNLPVLPYLWDQGVRHIPRIVPTCEGALRVYFAEGVLVVFSYVPGEHLQVGQHEDLLFDGLTRVYRVPPPDFLAREHFSPQAERDVSIYLTTLTTFPHQAASDIARVMRDNLPLISQAATRLQYFAARCMGDDSGFLLTHGDPKGNGLLHEGQVSLIDWDDPLYAPPERDAWHYLTSAGAVDSFNEALSHNGIHYTLRQERLAYYGYAMFFQYLREGLACFFDMFSQIDPQCIVDMLKTFFSSTALEPLWIMESWT